MADEAIRKAADDLIEAFEAFVDLVVERLPVKEVAEPKEWTVALRGLPIERTMRVNAHTAREAIEMAADLMPDCERWNGKPCQISYGTSDAAVLWAVTATFVNGRLTPIGEISE